MARTINQVMAQVIAEKETHTSLAQLNSPSAVAIWRMWVYVFAVCVVVLEKLIDVFKADFEVTASQSIAGTPAWIAYMIKKWQSGDIIQLNLDSNSPGFLTFYYPVVNLAKQIVTRVYVATGVNKTVNIKVAKGTTATALTTTEKNELSGYIRQFLPAGVTFNLVSVDGDKIAISANIYFDGQYSITIKDSVKNALLNYLANLDFNGVIKVSKIQDVIQAIAGVNDVVITDIQIRNYSQAYGTGLHLVVGSAVVIKDAVPFSGYAIEETEATHTFNDTLNFIAQ
jgi:hypothetical protein